MSLSLSSTKLDAYAFIHPSSQHESSWRMMGGFQKIARQEGRRVMTLEIGPDGQRQSQYLAQLRELQVCGAIVSPFFVSARALAQFSAAVTKCEVPVVTVGTQLFHVECAAVFFDSFHAAYSVTRMLLDSGCRRIGFLSSEAAATRNYHNGYRWALEDRKIEPEPHWELREEFKHPDFERPLAEPAEFGTRFVEQCGDQIEAVVCTNDYLAMGVILAARRVGLRVPEDLKVVGVDGLDCAANWDVPVTSYELPFEEAGEQAFRVLDALLEGATPSSQEVRLRGRIVRRTSA
jgi:DNA-binding LacI/PurR family transcriptional regulator